MGLGTKTKGRQEQARIWSRTQQEGSRNFGMLSWIHSLLECVRIMWPHDDGSAGMRVSPAVTRLTVSSRPQVMRPGERSGLSDQNYLWHGCASIVTCSRSTRQIFIRFSGNTPQVPRNVSLEAHDIPRHGSGDPLENIFCGCDGMMGLGRNAAMNAH